MWNAGTVSISATLSRSSFLPESLQGKSAGFFSLAAAGNQAWKCHESGKIFSLETYSFFETIFLTSCLF